MLIDTRTTGDPIAETLARISRRGVAVEPWLHQSQLAHTERPSHPILYLVEGDAPPPTSWGLFEDWVRLPAQPEELHHRADRLIHRARQLGAIPLYVDEDDLLHVGDDRIVLTPLDARLTRVLLANLGQLVDRATASAALWPDGPPADPRALDNRLKNLRRRLEDAPLRVHTLRRRGLLLEWAPPTAA